MFAGQEYLKRVSQGAEVERIELKDEAAYRKALKLRLGVVL